MKKKFTKPLSVVYLLLMTISTGLFAQNDQVVSGKVLSETDEPLPGVSVVIKDSNQGTITDVDGNYSLQASSNDVLIFSFIGYETKEIPVGLRTVIDISMEVNTQELSEVVVVGYGTQRKSHVTGSVAKVENDGLDKIPVSRADQALVGKLAGVQIQNTDTQPGQAPTIQVRGNASINAGNSPLLVVDGYPFPGDLSTIDMSDVESIEVLKDAASTAIYGSRGANGVIIITTRSGVVGEPQFRFSASTGVKTVYEKQNLYPTPNEWVDYVTENVSNWGLSEVPAEVVELGNLGIYTDWEDEFFRTGAMDKYTIETSGGTQNLKYLLSGNYTKDEGIQLTNNYERLNFRINLDAKINDHLEMGTSISPYLSTQRVWPLELHDGIRTVNYIPKYVDQDNIQYVIASGYDAEIGDIFHEKYLSNVNGTSLRLSTANNAYGKVIGRRREYKESGGYMNTYVRVNITENLSVRSSFGGFYRLRENEYFQPGWTDRSNNSQADYGTSKVIDWLNENTVNYNTTLGDHSIDILGGFTLQKTTSTGASIRAVNFLTDDIETLNAGTVTTAQTLESEQSLMSYLMRLTYDYKDKYLASFSSRWDASSKFGANNRWGFFPSVSLGWRVSEEPFLQGNRHISQLKLRTSYGATGNNGIPNYSAIASLSPVNSIIGNTIAQGFTESTLANQDLGWERTFEFDLGFDLGLFNNRLQLTYDFYRAETDQLLLYLNVPAVTGFENVWQNRGKMKNTGMELELSSRNVNSKNFQWTTSLNISGNRNELLDFGDSQEIITTVESTRPNQFLARVGDPLVQFYGYVATDEIPRSEMQNPGWPLNVDNISTYVKDLNGDGEITDEDRKVLGSPYPDFIWGITNDFKYKNFNLNIVLQGSQGAEVFNVDKYYWGTYWFGYNNLSAEEAAKTQQKVVTDDFVMDASFLAIRSVYLGYTIPESILSKLKMKAATVYVTGSNLLYLTGDDYVGYNPEGINRYTDNPLSYGYQRGASPVNKTFSVGVDITF